MFSGELNVTDNGFTRRFYAQPIKQIEVLKVNQTIRNFSGITSKNLFFETADPAIFYKADITLKRTDVIHFPIKESQALTSMFISCINSPYLYIAGGNIPLLVQVNLDSNIIHYTHLPTHTFSRFAVISNGSFAYRMYKKINGKWEQVFVKRNVSSDIQREQTLTSERKGDAGFSTDGLLHYDSTTHKLVYIHYYNDLVICMDTNLNVLYNLHTVDTVATTLVTADKHNTGAISEYTNTKPIRDVNLQSCADNGLLYINSNLKADNEARKPFNNNAVIDVYSIADRKYKGSFYIPDYNNERLHTFKVYKNHVYVLYNDEVVLYQINL